MLQMKFPKILVGFLFLILAISISAQTKRKPIKKKTAKKPVPAKTQAVVEDDATVVTTTETKKNSRPETETQNVTAEKSGETVKTNSRPVATSENKPVYFYEFSKAEFTVSKVLIEHDENGKGKITFQKKDLSEPESDPIQLSPAALERTKAAWQALNFLDSTENYQHERDYPQLGTMNFTMKKDGRTRTATFNWTDNKDARILADEYRKIGQQAVWIFDINVARQNQPLDAPRLLDSLESLIRRNEVSDAEQMIPFLKELNNDERLPLIARNHAVKLIEKIEKEKKKENKK